MADERDKYLSEEERLEKEFNLIERLGFKGLKNLSEEEAAKQREKAFQLGAQRLLEAYPELVKDFPGFANGEDRPGEHERLEELVEKWPREQRNALWVLDFTEEPFKEALAKSLAAEEAQLAIREEGATLGETLTGPRPTVEAKPEPEAPLLLEPSPPKEKNKDQDTLTAALSLNDAGDLDEGIAMLEELSKTAKSELMRKRAEEELLKARAKQGPK